MYYFIVNPSSRSGNGKSVWQAAEQILEKEQVEYQVFFTSYRYHATELAREITSRPEKLTLIAVGGDGTINEILNGIQDFSRVTFAYIPTGSSNDFARSLGLPSIPEEAVRNILHPTYLRRIDLGQAVLENKKQYFAVSCGFGFDAAVCQEALSSRIKDFLNHLKLGKLTYVGIALKQLILCKTFPSTLILDGKEQHSFSKTFFVTGMNCCYEGGGLKLCPRANPEDGMLDVFVVENLPKLLIACMLPTAYFGKHTIFPGIHLYRTDSFELRSNTEAAFHTDGEPDVVSNRLKVSCIPSCLTIIAGK